MYHVTFFDTATVTRAWVLTQNLKPFKLNMFNPKYRTNKFSKYSARLETSFKQAQNSLKLDLINRLRTFSFIERYPHRLNDLLREKRKTKQPSDVRQHKNPRRIVSSDLETSLLGTDIDHFLNGDAEDTHELSFTLLENLL